MSDLPDWAQDRRDAEAEMGDYQDATTSDAAQVIKIIAVLTLAAGAIVLSVLYTVGMWGVALSWWSS